MAGSQPLGEVYEDTRQRIVDLVRVTDVGATPVPACPEWSVHDLIAHMTGNCADIVAGNVDGVATPAWTARQVDARRDRTIAEILGEWDEVAPQVAPLVDDFPGRYGDMFVSDVISHEHDLRGAIGRRGGRDSPGVAICTDFLVTVFLHTGAAALGLAPLHVRAGERSWTVGTGGPASGNLESWREALLPDDDAPNDGVTPAGSLEAEPFELMRSIAGRRSAAQIRGLEWTVDPEPYLPVFGFGPFQPRPTDLHE